MTPAVKVLAGIGLGIALLAIVIAIVKKFFWLGLLGFALYFLTTRLPRLLKAAAKRDDDAGKQ